MLLSFHLDLPFMILDMVVFGRDKSSSPAADGPPIRSSSDMALLEEDANRGEVRECERFPLSLSIWSLFSLFDETISL